MSSDLLLEHHPHLLFHLPEHPFPIPSDTIELYYVYGMGSGEFYTALRDWLRAKPTRRLLFLEEDPNAIAYCLATPVTTALFADPQVVIHLLDQEQSLEELVRAYPAEHIQIDATYTYKQTPRFEALRLQLLRLTTVVHAHHLETLYAHLLLPNLLANCRNWPRSFSATALKDQFRGVPALICGAGPSLTATLPLLKALEDKLLLFAGGSAIAALSHAGITPHFGVAVDPNEEELERFHIATAYEMPLLYPLRLQQEVLKTCNGPLGYVHTATGGALEAYLEQECGIAAEPVGRDLNHEALSVTTLALALAVEMGCNPILLSGVDLSYVGNERYAPGVHATSPVDLTQTKASERHLLHEGRQGNTVSTLVKWVMESECIAAYAKNHPDRTFYQVSEGGLGFADIPYVPLEKVPFEHTYDLRGKVHAAIETAPLNVCPKKLQEVVHGVYKSLTCLLALTEEMLEELTCLQPDTSLPTGKMALLESDIREEIAYALFLAKLEPTLEALWERAHQEKSSALEKEREKYLYLKEKIQDEMGVFSTFGFGAP